MSGWTGPYNYLSSPEQAGKVLDWPLRYEIALGAAKAICYLHNDCIPRIIHGNIKSTNILLDTHMLPYVCDYGLAALQGFAAFEPTSSLSSRSCGYLSPGALAPSMLFVSISYVLSNLQWYL